LDNYYGRFYPSVLVRFLERIDQYLVRWAIQKYKRLRRHRMRSWTFPVSIKTREPNLFAHWKFNAQTNTPMMGAV
jgi:RNA-directed DNA polymerase